MSNEVENAVTDVIIAFELWWNPIRRDPEKGDIGGHDHARRWVKNKFGKFNWTGGLTASQAWACRCYRDEFRASNSDHAKAGTGVNYAKFGWFRPYEQDVPVSDVHYDHYVWLVKHKKVDDYPHGRYVDANPEYAGKLLAYALARGADPESDVMKRLRKAAVVDEPIPF